MPRKTRFTVEKVVMAAMELVRENGLAGLTAAAAAEKLRCSTMPIYTHFKNMDELKDEVIKKIWKLVMDYQTESYSGDAWVDQAFGWVRFSREEENLFRCIYDNHNLGLQFKMQKAHWQFLAERLKEYEGFQGMDEELCERARYSHSKLTHGLASSPRTGFDKLLIEDDRMLIGYLTSASRALLSGYRDAPPVDEADRDYVNEKKKAITD